MKNNKLSLHGEVHVWDFGDVKREYTTVTIPFATAAQIIKAEVYSAKTGHGEQREEIDAWVKKLKTSMEQGKFTPTSISVGTKEKHRKALRFHELDGTRLVELEIDLDSTPTLPLLNAQQRFAALKRIRKQAENPDVQAKIDALPVTAIIYLDGSTREDFINLNQGKAIDAAHLLSLKVQTKTVAEKDLPYYRVAVDIAKQLASDPDSPFVGQIRFDSRGIAPLTINTLCAKGGSDIGTSLMGLAKVALHAPNGPYDAEAMAETFKTAYRVIKEKAPDLMLPNKVITPPPEGTRGSATMLIGMAVVLAYRTALETDSDDVVHEQLVEAAQTTLDDMISGNFSGPIKRDYLGKFTACFFKDVEVEKHHGIPKELVKILSASTFAVPKLPKEKKKVVQLPKTGGRKKKDKVVPVEVTAPETPAQEVISQPQAEIATITPKAEVATPVPVEDKPCEPTGIVSDVQTFEKALSPEEVQSAFEKRNNLADRLEASYDEPQITHFDQPETDDFETPAGEATDLTPWDQEIAA